MLRRSPGRATASAERIAEEMSFERDPMDGGPPTWSHRPVASRRLFLLLFALTSCGVQFESGGGGNTPPRDGGPPDELPVDSGPTTYPTSGLRIVAGGDNTCVLSAAGHVACWGSSETGQLGIGEFGERRTPTWIPGLEGVVDLAVADFAMCALKTDGSVWCWGSNFYGQLGAETAKCPGLGYPCSALPVQAAVTGATRLIGNFHHFCAIIEPGHGLQCWGDAPSWDAPGYAVLSATTGDQHTCARFDPAPGQDPTRNVVCDGVASAGQLGTGTTDNAGPVPVTVGVTGGFVELAAGLGFTCGVSGDNKLYCWGQNQYAALGAGPGDDLNFPDLCPDFGSSCAKQPTEVSGLLPVAHVAAHFAWACAVATGGEVFCWGTPSHTSPASATACWAASPECIPTPQLVPGVDGARSIGVGYGHACAVTAADEIYCWGLDTHGQLGRGDGPSFETTPVKVELPPETF